MTSMGINNCFYKVYTDIIRFFYTGGVSKRMLQKIKRRCSNCCS